MQRPGMKKHTIQVPSPRPYLALDAGEDLERGVAVRAPLLRQLTYRSSPSFKRSKSGLTSPSFSASPSFSYLASPRPRVLPSPRINENETLLVVSSPTIQEETPLLPPLLDDHNRPSSKAPFVVLGFECLESTAFNGISTNLVVYLETVLHGSNLASASSVTTWIGTSYLTPIFGAIVADTYWGNYNTILVSLAFYLLGMILVTSSAFLSPVAAVAGASAGFLSAKTLAFVGLYLVAIGCGGVRSSLLPFGAEQFDDAVVADREGKAAFFSLFYLCVDFGPIVSGLLIVYIQQNVSWALGFGIATACIAAAYAAFLLATPMYKRTMPTGSPLKSLCQVVVAACRKVSHRLPSDAALLHEASDKEGDESQPRIAHTGEFRFFDKAAIYSELDLAERIDGGEPGSSWKLCTVTQVEELKILLRLLPVWTTSIIVSVAYSQMNTTFIQQGSAMDINVLSLSIPAASLGSFEVLSVLTWVLLYGRVIVPALSKFTSGGGEPSQLKRMGAGRVLMAISMAIAAVVETSRLGSAARGEQISIAWQLPQYFFLAGGEVFCYIAQLEFFYNEAPDTMKSMCTSLALLTIALGSYLSSFIYAVIAMLTATKDSPGWIADDLNEGHLDYFFWIMAAISMINFFVYSAFARNYKLKTVLS